MHLPYQVSNQIFPEKLPPTQTCRNLKSELELSEDGNMRQRLMGQISRNEEMIDDLVFDLYGFNKKLDAALIQEIKERVNSALLDSQK